MSDIESGRTNSPEGGRSQDPSQDLRRLPLGNTPENIQSIVPAEKKDPLNPAQRARMDAFVHAAKAFFYHLEILGTTERRPFVEDSEGRHLTINSEVVSGMGKVAKGLYTAFSANETIKRVADEELLKIQKRLEEERKRKEEEERERKRQKETEMMLPYTMWEQGDRDELV